MESSRDITQRFLDIGGSFIRPSAIAAIMTTSTDAKADATEVTVYLTGGGSIKLTGEKLKALGRWIEGPSCILQKP